MARARYDAFIARYGEDEDVVAYQWKLGSRHPAEDICDMYAEVDLYGLGKGVFPKDAAPVNPAHPHCLCHYAPVYESELEGKKRSNNVEAGGNAWLKKQSLSVQEKILGVKGREEWKAGRAGWMEKARNFEIWGIKESRLFRVLERRKKNTPDFSGFKVLMKMKSVKEICRKYDLKTHEISYKIQLDKGSIRGGYYGSSDPRYIGRVDLFPNAFRDEDELLKTIIHENCHVLQFKKYGSIYVQHHMDRMEVVARRFESFFFYVKRLGEDKKWVDEMVQLNDGVPHVKCPLCGKENLDYGFIFMSKEDNIGISAVWCNDCNRGKVLSRTSPMPNTKVIEDLPKHIEFTY